MAANVHNRKANEGRRANRVKRDSFVLIHFKQAKVSLLSFTERPFGNLLTLAVISMALVMPSTLYLLGKNISAASSHVSGSSQISVYIAEQTTEARVMIIKDNLESLDDVSNVEYISPQQGLNELSEYSGFERAISLLDDYALPGVLIITPSIEDNTAIDELTSSISKIEEITDIRMDDDWLSRLDAVKNLAGGIAAILSVLMLSSVFLIVGNTLRFNVQANKEEIQTMKLIGATNSFILRPYLYAGTWFGLLGALIAWLMTAVITVLLNNSVEQLALLYDSHFQLIGLSWDESLILLMLGGFLGCLAAKVSAQSHLKDIEPV